MAKTTEVIVSNESIKDFNKVIVGLANKVEGLLNEYITIMKDASETSIISGEAHEEMRMFYSCVKDLSLQFKVCAMKTKSTNSEFINQVDIDDKYLY